MSLAESKRSSGDISLSHLHEEKIVSGTSPLSYHDLAAEAVRGGWPALLDSTPRQAITYNRSYCNDLYASDIPLATGSRHDPIRMRRLFESLSRTISSSTSLESLARDVSADGGAATAETVRTYLDALSRIFILEELPAWSVALRSKSRLRTRPKRFLTDPSLGRHRSQARLEMDP